MAARPGSASYVWKSICDARAVLERDGKNISVWQDRWPLRLSTFRPFSPYLDANLEGLKVCNLLLPSGGWNEGFIISIFMKEDGDIICDLTTSSMGVEDKLVWHYDRFGQYTRKTGYHVARFLQD